MLFIWMILACSIFKELGAFKNQFMTFGPSQATVFMAMKIDTWSKWLALAVFSMLNTMVNEFIGSALVPWFTNTIQDQKTQYLDHTKRACLIISLIYDVYTHVMSIFGIFLMFSQVDFLFIRMVADCVVTVFTTKEWIKKKVYDKEKHDLEGGFVNIHRKNEDGDDDDDDDDDEEEDAKQNGKTRRSKKRMKTLLSSSLSLSPSLSNENLLGSENAAAGVGAADDDDVDVEAAAGGSSWVSFEGVAAPSSSLSEDDSSDGKGGARDTIHASHHQCEKQAAHPRRYL